MGNIELSIDGSNRATEIRDAVINAEPDECHGCTKAFDRSYNIGQFARMNGLTPDEAAVLAWGSKGFCCRSLVSVELQQPLPELPATQEKVLVS